MSIQALQSLVDDSQNVVGFSGAGISTESGIPDFRSPDGIWSQNRTVDYQTFLQNRQDRIEYWRQKVAIWPEMRNAQPNEGHLFFARLFQAKKLRGVITQNIEGLHQRSGLPDDRVIELHGTMRDVTCLDCHDKTTMDEACQRVASGDLAPECNLCGGLLKPATISFGQSLVAKDMDQAALWSQTCDLLIAVGSSLVVQPAAGFPALAKQCGAKLVIINRTQTPIDPLADLVICAEIGPTLAQINIA